MGYYNKMGVVKKMEYDTLKSLTPIELSQRFNIIEKDDYINVNDFIYEIYNFGKGVEFDTLNGTLSNFFLLEESQMLITDDEELFLASPEFLECMILSYKEKIVNFYNEMGRPFLNSNFFKTASYEINLETYKDDYSFDFEKLTQEETNAIFAMISHINSYRIQWQVGITFDLKVGNAITKSDKYEHAIFELIHLYKTFDWEKNVLVYYGG